VTSLSSLMGMIVAALQTDANCKQVFIVQTREFSTKILFRKEKRPVLEKDRPSFLCFRN